MVDVVINLLKCNLCLECVGICPSEALLYDESFLHDSTKCTYCESCYDVCEEQCIEFVEGYNEM